MSLKAINPFLSHPWDYFEIRSPLETSETGLHFPEMI